MDELIEGYRRFRTDIWADYRARMKTLASEGQRPNTLVIACSDSRVDPQMIFGAGPGELFVVRNVANLVPPYAPDSAYHGTSSALEFAVRGLGVSNIVVMGHGGCGGIHALLNGVPGHLGDFLEPWIQLAAPARKSAFECVPGDRAAERQLFCEHASIKLTVENLKTFPWVREKIEAGELKVYGCWFELASGRLLRLGKDGEFWPVDSV